MDFHVKVYLIMEKRSVKTSIKLFFTSTTGVDMLKVLADQISKLKYSRAAVLVLITFKTA